MPLFILYTSEQFKFLMDMYGYYILIDTYGYLFYT